MQMLWRMLALGLLLPLAVTIPAAAHKPMSIGGTFPSFDQALRVESIGTSQVAYSELDETNHQLWLTFDAAAGTTLVLSLGLPALERLADYRPNLAVLGPGLPAVALPIDTPTGLGGIVYETTGVSDPRFFHEPFTGTDSWIVLEESLELPETGTYYVVAWPPGEKADKLWVAIGTREEFGLRDVLSLSAIVRDVRAFHEAGPRVRGLGTVGKIAFLGLAAALIAWLASSR